MLAPFVVAVGRGRQRGTVACVRAPCRQGAHVVRVGMVDVGPLPLCKKVRLDKWSARAQGGAMKTALWIVALVALYLYAGYVVRVQCRLTMWLVKLPTRATAGNTWVMLWPLFPLHVWLAERQVSRALTGRPDTRYSSIEDLLK